MVFKFCETSSFSNGAGKSKGILPDPVPVNDKPTLTAFSKASFDLSNDFKAFEIMFEGISESLAAVRSSTLAIFFTMASWVARTFLFWFSILLSSRMRVLWWATTEGVFRMWVKSKPNCSSWHLSGRTEEKRWRTFAFYAFRGIFWQTSWAVRRPIARFFKCLWQNNKFKLVYIHVNWHY